MLTSYLSNDVLQGDGGVLEVDLGRVGTLDSHLLLGRAVGHAAEGALHDEGRHLQIEDKTLHKSLIQYLWKAKMDLSDRSEETAAPILKILVSEFSLENSPGAHVFRFFI